MGNEHDRRVNDIARKTGLTRAELLTDALNMLQGEPKGLGRWVERIKQTLRRPTETDRENRRIFEEGEAKSHEEILRLKETARKEMGDHPTTATQKY